MYFGVRPPWYDNPVEQTAFNLYILEIEENEEEETEE